MAIHDKPVANIALNGKNLKPFPLKSEIFQGDQVSSLVQYTAKIPGQRNKARERNKRGIYKKGRNQIILIFR
jgi:hypothetical protein